MRAIGLIVLSAAVCAAAEKPSAREVVERIQKHVNVPWRTGKTIDTFKAGDPETPVTGIATTFIATMDVLRRAAASGKNLIVTHEPTFYNHEDAAAGFEGDAVTVEKKAFIEQHHLVVWRFHDHSHLHRPDMINAGMVEKLGWAKYKRPGDEILFDIPETTVGKLASQLRLQLADNGVRVVGNLAMKVTKVAFTPGAPPASMQIHALRRDDVEVLLAGETREWETVEYARDASAQGKKKALIVLGHALTEEPGMEFVAKWLKTFIQDVPVEFIPAGQPFVAMP